MKVMPPLSVMVKPASSLCNLRCRYCFYNNVSEIRDVSSFGIMSEKTADNLIKKALRFADGENISFTFQGGEPLLAGLPFFEYFVKKVCSENTNNSTVYFSVQTNGTLITEEWAKFFYNNKILVGLSLDGDFDHNSFRIDESGNNSFQKIMNAAEMLRRYKVDFNILTVLTGRCADNIDEIYSFFKSKNFKYLQFIPCLRPFGDKSESELYMTNEQYGNFLIKCFNYYLEDYLKGQYTSIRYFDNIINMILGNSAEQCGVCGHCMYQFVSEANGNIYPCDFYCTDEWLLGNINGENENFDTLAHCEKAIEFLRESFAVSEKCKECPIFSLCRGGGCKRMKQDRDYCEAYKKFFYTCLPSFKYLKKG